jgi:hypothetical protein
MPNTTRVSQRIRASKSREREQRTGASCSSSLSRSVFCIGRREEDDGSFVPTEREENMRKRTRAKEGGARGAMLDVKGFFTFEGS